MLYQLIRQASKPCCHFVFVTCASLLLLSGCGGDGNDDPTVTETKVAKPRKKTKPELAAEESVKWYDEIKSNPTDGDRHTFSGAGIELIRPIDSTLATRFHGFQSLKEQYSITISRSPLPFVKETKPVIEYLATGPGTNPKKPVIEEFTIQKYPAIYTHYSEITGGETFQHHLVAFGGKNVSWTVDCVYKLDAHDEVARDLLNSVLSAKVIEGFDPQQNPQVNFSVDATTLKQTNGWTKAVVFTTDGELIPEKNPDPFFKVYPSALKIIINEQDRQQFALQNLPPSKFFKVEHVFISREIGVDELAGFEIMAFAKEQESQKEFMLYSAHLFDEDSYYHFQGWVGNMVLEDYTTEFQKITRSFKRYGSIDESENITIPESGSSEGENPDGDSESPSNEAPVTDQTTEAKNQDARPDTDKDNGN